MQQAGAQRLPGGEAVAGRQALGLGEIGQGVVGQGGEIPGAQLVAVYNRTVEKAQATAARFEVPRVYADAQEMLEREALDFVDIITDVNTHAAFVRSTLGLVGAYYGLWAAADVLILCGVDAGWLVRLVPNQLYYGLFVPFVWWRFFDRGEARAAA